MWPCAPQPHTPPTHLQRQAGQEIIIIHKTATHTRTPDLSSLKVLRTPPASCKQTADSPPAIQIAASLNLYTRTQKVSQNQSQRGRDRVASLRHEWLIQSQVLWCFHFFLFCFSCLFISDSFSLTAADATWRCGKRLLIWIKTPQKNKSILPQITKSSTGTCSFKMKWCEEYAA